MTCIPIPLPELQVQGLDSTDDSIGVTLITQTQVATFPCPQCGTLSKRVHSYYWRKGQDLPISDQSTRLLIRARRFRCLNVDCPRQTFAEPVALLPAYARRTVRFTDSLRSVAFALGGEAGCRLATQLRMPTSPDTLLRLIRQTCFLPASEARVVGVDDWAFRKGVSYGTILLDLEKHCPIDLLPDRSAASLSAWLSDHPGIEIITRDRSTEYTKGATEGAPSAIQVADRWHLLSNLRQCLERMLSRIHARLNALPLSEGKAKTTARRKAFPRTPIEQEGRRAKRQQRYQRYQQVVSMYQQGQPILQIAEQLGMSRVTVRKYAYSQAFPERAGRTKVRSILDPYLPYLERRHWEGYENALQLWRELVQRGFTGTHKQVSRWMQQRRTQPATGRPASSSSSEEVDIASGTSLLSARQLSWFLVRDPTKVPEEDQPVLSFIRQDNEVETAYQLAQQFITMVRERTVNMLDTWLEAITNSEIVDLQNFADGIQQDYRAVRAALETEWSNGQTEGQVNRLKCLKRQMYGRAKFDLLRQRVLFRA